MTMTMMMLTTTSTSKAFRVMLEGAKSYDVLNMPHFFDTTVSGMTHGKAENLKKILQVAARAC